MPFSNEPHCNAYFVLAYMWIRAINPCVCLCFERVALHSTPSASVFHTQTLCVLWALIEWKCVCLWIIPLFVVTPTLLIWYLVLADLVFTYQVIMVGFVWMENEAISLRCGGHALLNTHEHTHTHTHTHRTYIKSKSTRLCLTVWHILLVIDSTHIHSVACRPMHAEYNIQPQRKTQPNVIEFPLYVHVALFYTAGNCASIFVYFTGMLCGNDRVRLQIMATYTS